VHSIPLLKRIDFHVVKRHQAGDKLAIKEVVRGVDGAQARVRVVVRVHAGTERPLWGIKNK